MLMFTTFHFQHLIVSRSFHTNYELAMRFFFPSCFLHILSLISEKIHSYLILFYFYTHLTVNMHLQFSPIWNPIWLAYICFAVWLNVSILFFFFYNISNEPCASSRAKKLKFGVNYISCYCCYCFYLFSVEKKTHTHKLKHLYINVDETEWDHV